MAKFDLKGLLNDRSVPDRQQDQKIVYRNPEDLIPSEDNFYNTEKLEMLKQSIELLGILQPLLIENRDGKDYVIAGHCRRKCCIDLIQEGNDKFSRIPCIYKSSSELEQDASQGDEIVRQIMLIQANGILSGVLADVRKDACSEIAMAAAQEKKEKKEGE